MADRDVVAIQLGRPPRSTVDVVRRCHLDLPVVIAVPPLLDDGTPFPTRYWLTCPLAVRRIGRSEAVGGVREAEARITRDPDVAERHARATERYVAERDALVPPGAVLRPSGGIAGTARGIKCLHAHYADHAAGHDNPTGEWVAPDVEPLDCSVPCVVSSDAGAEWNEDWSEPHK